ncbi:MAG: hypothetical protein CMJ59_18285, partial [Planctomycetaceae bacterium]|nr:hypothetical protein [Planctomycetaceae bacterium]
MKLSLIMIPVLASVVFLAGCGDAGSQAPPPSDSGATGEAMMGAAGTKAPPGAPGGDKPAEEAPAEEAPAEEAPAEEAPAE